jgi:hypothetical protein
MDTTTTAAPRRPRSGRPVPWRRAAGTAAGVLAVGVLAGLVLDTDEASHRPAVVVTPAAASSSASSEAADASSIWRSLLQLDAAQDAAARAALSPEVRAAVDELDRRLAASEAARQSHPDTIGITEMYGAFWAGPPFGSTIGIIEMCGAFWAGPPLGSTIGITEMYGAFWAASDR